MSSSRSKVSRSTAKGGRSTVGGSRRSTGGRTGTSGGRGSGHRGGGYGIGGNHIVELDGVDVTPKSLLPSDSYAVRSLPAGGKGRTGNSGSDQQSSTEGGDRLSTGFSRSSARSASSHAGSDADEFGLDLSTAPLLEADATSGEHTKREEDTKSKKHDAVATEQVKLELTEEELNAPVSLTLCETETVEVLCIPGLRVLSSTAEHAAVSSRNERYSTFVSHRAANMDMYNEKHSQTLNFAQKAKNVAATMPTTRDVECTAESWDIYDAAEQTDLLPGEGIELEVVGKSTSTSTMTDFEKAVEEVVASHLASKDCLLDVEGSVRIAAPGGGREPAPGRGGGRRGADGTSRSRYGTTRSGVRASGTATGSGSGTSRSGARMGASSVGVSSSRSRSRAGGAGQTSRSSTGSRSANPGSGSAVGSGSGGGGGGGGVGGGVADDAGVVDVVAQRKVKEILSSRSLLRALRTVERAIQQNVYHRAHRSYRAVSGAEFLEEMLVEEDGDDDGVGGADGDDDGLAGLAGLLDPIGGGDIGSDSKGIDEDDAASAREDKEPEVELPPKRLQKLWSYRCPITFGKNVSCMVWNVVNQDLLAVAYGQSDYGSSSEGLICFWSMKNPEYPQCVLKTTSGVTALDFSTAHPNLLAAGMYDGTVAIYDVRKSLSGDDDGMPQLVSERTVEGSHTDAVWQVKWVDKGGDRGERLVSISTDGRVKEWDTKKGLTCADLMTLKRVRTGDSASGEEKGDGALSRRGAGLCIDFPWGDDTSIYFCGTEDGVLHRCSVSYALQFLESIPAHAGPINRVRVSPYIPNALLTCSADWTIKLWDTSREGPTPAVFQAPDATDAITDIAWSPQHSTRFASVSGDGHVIVWDATSLTPEIKFDAVHDGTSPEASAPPTSRTAPGTGRGGEETKSSSKDAKDAKDAKDSKDAADETSAMGSSGTPTTFSSLMGPKRLSAVTFAFNAPVLVTGDSQGQVDVYRLVGLDEAPETMEEMEDRLLGALTGT